MEQEYFFFLKTFFFRREVQTERLKNQQPVLQFSPGHTIHFTLSINGGKEFRSYSREFYYSLKALSARDNRE